jgi:hypothetical protein
LRISTRIFRAVFGDFRTVVLSRQIPAAEMDLLRADRGRNSQRVTQIDTGEKALVRDL